MRDVAIVLAVVKSRVFLIRRRSRIDRKQDSDTEEIWSDMVSDESNMTPRLRAELDGVIESLRHWRAWKEPRQTVAYLPLGHLGRAPPPLVFGNRYFKVESFAAGTTFDVPS